MSNDSYDESHLAKVAVVVFEQTVAELVRWEEISPALASHLIGTYVCLFSKRGKFGTLWDRLFSSSDSASSFQFKLATIAPRKS